MSVSKGKYVIAGHVWNAGVSTPSTVTNDKTAVPEGTSVFVQWQDKDGSVSPIYTAKTSDQLSGAMGGPGAFAFKLPSWTDAFGKNHYFTADAKQQYRLWVEPITNPATGGELTAMRVADGMTPYRFVKVSSGDGALGAVTIAGTNVRNTGVFLYEKPQAHMQSANTVVDDAGPVAHPSVQTDEKYTVSGTVWLETGAGDRSNVATGPNQNLSLGDVPAAGYTVYVSMLNREGAAANKAIKDLDRNARAAATKEMLVANPGYVAKTVAAVTDAEGNYTARVGEGFWDYDNMYTWVADPAGNIVSSYSSSTFPAFGKYNSTPLWTPQTVPALNPALLNVYNRNHAVVPFENANIDVTNFDAVASPASPGDTATLALSGNLTPLETVVTWRDAAGSTLETCAPITSAQDVAACTLTVPKDLEKDEMYTATLWAGDIPVSADSFAARVDGGNTGADANAGANSNANASASASAAADGQATAAAQAAAQADASSKASAKASANAQAAAKAAANQNASTNASSKAEAAAKASAQAAANSKNDSDSAAEGTAAANSNAGAAAKAAANQNASTNASSKASANSNASASSKADANANASASAAADSKANAAAKAAAMADNSSDASAKATAKATATAQAAAQAAAKAAAKAQASTNASTKAQASAQAAAQAAAHSKADSDSAASGTAQQSATAQAAAAVAANASASSDASGTPVPPTAAKCDVTKPRAKSPFLDVATGYKFYPEIDWMHCTKLSTGWKVSGGHEYRASADMTREAMAAFIFRMQAPKNYKAPKKSLFKDVKTNHKFYREIMWMKESGISTGYADGTYRPGSKLDRDAMAAFIFRINAPRNYAPKTQSFSDVDKNTKFYKEIEWMGTEGLSKGYWTAAGPEYRPKNGLSREAMAAFLQRLVDEYWVGVIPGV
ncbi:S-layer homology domain-containing protein, partial [Leucobacter sp. HY1908]